MTSIYQAIMKAADHIDAYPEEFLYEAVRIPRAKHCGTPGCAFGWVAHFMGIGLEIVAGGLDGKAEKIGLISYWDHFQPRMDDLGDGGTNGWRWHATKCARTLRLYAAKYHAEPVSDPAFTRFKALLAQDQPQRERESV